MDSSVARGNGPKLFYPLEAIFECMHNEATLSIHSPLALLDDVDEKEWQLREFCAPLLIGARRPSQHFQELDIQLATLLPTGLHRHPSQLTSRLNNLEAPLISQLEQMLSRLPQVPQRRFALPLSGRNLQRGKKTIWEGIRDGRWASEYILPEVRTQLQSQPSENPEEVLAFLSEMKDVVWDNLLVTTYLDSNSIILARMIASRGFTPDLEFAQNCLRYTNLLSELLDEFQALQDAFDFGITEIFSSPEPSIQALKNALSCDIDDDNGQGCSILKAFLWTAWQRSVMLYFYYIIGVQLCSGYSSTWNALLCIRGVGALSSLQREDYKDDTINYVCNWAFELLRTSRSAVGLDFRRMLHRFDEHFQGRLGRCRRGSHSACDGDRPESCQRFTGAETKAQSAHGRFCNRTCKKIVWDESSYRACESPQAVVVDENLGVLQYCRMPSNTLAISHVWSHGHGGRPETGINSCLHLQYCQVARASQCRAYWIDSACIPSYGPLRKIAIENINRIFTESKVTLIIDQDIQSIDMSSLTVDKLETLLSVLLVCDWNVRAWTMLEAIRGSGSIYLLCKDDKVISLDHCLQRIHQEGAIDLAVLLGSVQHLIPHLHAGSPKTVEEASYLLSQRHASRPKDEVVIWSLLNNGPGDNEPSKVWKAQTHVRTGFLMSHALRVGSTKCLGWAPQSPYNRPLTRYIDLEDGEKQYYTVRFPSYDGQGSFLARITPEGLLGKWRVMEMETEALRAFFDNCFEQMIGGLEEVRQMNPNLSADTTFYSFPDEANAYRLMETLLNERIRVRLLRPLAEDGASIYEGSSHREERIGLVAAICASSDDGKTWDWKNVYHWQDSDNNYAWTIEEMLIT